ncbi:hypothetical protein GbCGDNIH7_7114 [Granulibacter bethesdensis]|nr:hypothetical protein GbCGDNIH7_7114 [Granulibacter bethesdensis]
MLPPPKKNSFIQNTVDFKHSASQQEFPLKSRIVFILLFSSYS